MQRIEKTLERMNSVTGIPFSLLDSEGRLLTSFPGMAAEASHAESNATVITDFRLQKRDRQHPLISFIDPGFLLGVVELNEERYVLVGLVSPYVHTRADILHMVGESIHPPQLQSYCDQLLNQPLVSLEKLKDIICLLTALLGEAALAPVAFYPGASARPLLDSDAPFDDVLTDLVYIRPAVFTKPVV